MKWFYAPITAPLAMLLSVTVPPPCPAGPSALEPLLREYAADQADVDYYYDLPGAPLRFERLGTLYSNWLVRLESVNFEALPQPGKVDFLLIKNDLEGSLDALALEQARWQELAPLLSFSAIIYALEQARWEGVPVNGQALASQVSELSRTVKQLKEHVEKGMKTNAAPGLSVTIAAAPATHPPPMPIAPPLAQRAAASTERLRAVLKKWYTFHSGYQPDFSWWLKAPYEEADKRLEEYAKFLKEDVAGQKGKDDDPLIGQPIGPEALSLAIRHEIIPYDTATLLQIGVRERVWCEVELKRAAGKMGLGDNWRAALARIKSDFAGPGQQGELVGRTAREAITFVKDRRLVSVPPLCEETWHLTMMSPETMKTIPYAAYNNQDMMVAYARDDMNHEDKLMTMRGNNRHFVHTVTPHELIPGHHLQRFYARRDNPARAVFATPFHVEGWSLYWERRLWDLGWARTPEQQLGMLFWRLNRVARIEVTLKFHLGQMSPAGMVDFLVEQVGHERLGATGEVRRFIGEGFSPLYQAAYMLGGLQLESLRKEAVGGGHFTEQEFHDAVLTRNAIPVEWIRAELLNYPLTRDTRSTWKF